MVEFCAGIIVGACLSYIAIIISLDREKQKDREKTDEFTDSKL